MQVIEDFPSSSPSSPHATVLLTLKRHLLWLTHTLLCSKPFSVRSHRLPLILALDLTLPHGPHEPIPEGKVWLAEVGLDAPALMMDVVIGGIVAAQALKWIPR